LYFIGNLNGHSSLITKVLSLSNGYLASASTDKTIKIWDPINFVIIKTLLKHTDYVIALAELPNGDLVSGSKDKTIKIWNMSDGSVKFDSEHTKSVVDIAVLKNGDIVAGFFGSLKIWDSTLVRLKKSFDVYLPMSKFLILSNQDYVVTAFRNQINVFDMKNEKVIKTLNTTNSVDNLACLNDGFITTSSNQVLEMDTNLELKQNFTIYSTYLNAITVSPKGKIVCGTGSNEIQIWNQSKLENKVSISSFVTSLIFSKNGNLACVNFNNISIYDF